MLEKDFTMKKYDILCQSISKSNFKTYTIEELITCNQEIDGNFIILRHDVDKSPSKAHIMANIEQKYGLKATYYFRTINQKLFDKDVITKIKNLGHEIGYHYEVLSTSKGDFEEAYNFFCNSIEDFQNIGIKVKTAAFHGSPLSKYNNRDFWSRYSIDDFNLLGLAYDGVNFENIYYLTDTGRTFGQTSSNLRDRPETPFLFNKKIKSTSDIIKLLEEDGNIYITTHPERWAKGSIDWYWEYIFQNFKNMGKSFLNYARK